MAEPHAPSTHSTHSHQGQQRLVVGLALVAVLLAVAVVILVFVKDSGSSDSNPNHSSKEEINGCTIEPGTECEDADLRSANLASVDLSGSDLAGADLTEANLSGANLSGAKVADKAGNVIVVSSAPLILYGLDYLVMVWDEHLKIGCEMHKIADWKEFSDRRIAEMDGLSATKFWRRHKAALLALAESDGRGVEPEAAIAKAES